MIKETMVDISNLHGQKGSELKGFKLECPKHGNVSEQVFPIMFDDSDGRTKVQFICKGCLAEYFSRLVEKGELEAVLATPIFEESTNSEGETSENAKTASSSLQ